MKSQCQLTRFVFKATLEMRAFHHVVVMHIIVTQQACPRKPVTPTKPVSSRTSPFSINILSYAPTTRNHIICLPSLQTAPYSCRIPLASPKIPPNASLQNYTCTLKPSPQTSKLWWRRAHAKHVKGAEFRYVKSDVTLQNFNWAT